MVNVMNLTWESFLQKAKLRLQKQFFLILGLVNSPFRKSLDTNQNPAIPQELHGASGIMGISEKPLPINLPRMNSLKREHDRKVFKSLGPLSSCEEKMVRMVMAHYEARLFYQAVMLSRGADLKALQEQAAWNYLRYRKVINSEDLKPVKEIRLPKGYKIGEKRKTILEKIVNMKHSLPGGAR